MPNDRCLTVYGPLVQQIELLWRRQCDEWDMLRTGRADLQAALTRSFVVDGSRVIAQCNWARVRSAAARVDAASVAARPCFLCEPNLPAGQRAVAYQDGWRILCNPAPIFDPHFTIVRTTHEPQLLELCLEVLLDLARDLDSRYTVFYNGPFAGASAPDHAHLQASPAGATPFENELAVELCVDRANNGPKWIEWLRRGAVRVGLTRPGRRPAVIVMGSDRQAIIAAVQEVLHGLQAIHPAQPEPMLNLLATFTDQRWLVWLHPRQAHRPSCYGQEPDRYLISPGAVDLAGLLIAPRRADFERLDGPTIRSIYFEVLLSPDKFAQLRQRLAG